VTRGRCRSRPALIIGFGLLLLSTGLPQAAPQKPTTARQPNQASLIAQLASTRRDLIATARSVQQRQSALTTLQLAVSVMQQGVTAKQQEFDQNAKAQEQLLGALERLARALPEELAFAPEGPIDRERSAILIAAAVPALQTQARSLAGDLAALTHVRHLIAARKPELDKAQAALDQANDTMATLIARRADLSAQLLSEDGKIQGAAQFGDQASDLFDLIKQADANADEHDQDRLIQQRVPLPLKKKGAGLIDPTKPADLRALDAAKATMLWPASGDLTKRFGEADRFGRPSQGVTINTNQASLVIAPFDGRVVYAGPFRSYGLILIIRHGGGYHSLLAGLGRVDVTPGQWVLAGEPVAVMAGPDDKNANAGLYLELRRDGRPVDPQSRLAARDNKAGE
jgi:murein hydrolase activator